MIVDADTGEIMKDKFSQMYFKDIQKLLGLSGSDLGTLFLMSKAIGLGNNGSLKMTPKRKKAFATELGLKTHLQITACLNKLVVADVIKKAEPDDRFDSEYIVNPDIIFSGNDYQRAKILIDYSDGTRRVKAFSNENTAAEWLMQNSTQKTVQ